MTSPPVRNDLLPPARGRSTTRIVFAVLLAIVAVGALIVVTLAALGVGFAGGWAARVIDAPYVPAPTDLVPGRCDQAHRCCDAYVAAMGVGAPADACGGVDNAARMGAAGDATCVQMIDGWRQGLQAMNRAVPAACSAPPGTGGTTAAGGNANCDRARRCCTAYIEAMGQQALQAQVCRVVDQAAGSPMADTVCLSQISGWRSGLTAMQKTVPADCAPANPTISF